MMRSSILLASGLSASALAQGPLATIYPCPSCPTEIAPSAITVTAQYQTVSTCTPVSTAPSYSVYGAVYKPEASCSAYPWVSTVIPCAGGSSTTVTKTEQVIKIGYTTTVETSAYPCATRVPSGQGYAYSNSTCPGPKYTTVELDISCPYKEIGPHALPGYPGSGLCTACDEKDDKGKYQVVTVTKCVDKSCSTYPETWVYAKPTTPTSVTSAYYHSSTYCPTGGIYTIPVTAVYTPHAPEFTKPATHSFYYTTYVPGPQTIEITKTITVTYQGHPATFGYPATVAGGTTHYPVGYPTPPGSSPAVPTHVPSYPVDAPFYPVEGPSHPVDVPVYPVERPSHPVDVPVYPVERPSHPVDVPVYPVEGPSHPVDVPVYPVEGPSHPVDVPVYPVDVPSPQISAPSQPTGVTSYSINGPSPQISAPSQPINVLSYSINGPSPQISAPSQQIGVPSYSISGPSPQVSAPFQSISVPYSTSGPSPQISAPFQSVSVPFSTSGPTPQISAPFQSINVSSSTSGPTPQISAPFQSISVSSSTSGPTPQISAPFQSISVPSSTSVSSKTANATSTQGASPTTPPGCEYSGCYGSPNGFSAFILVETGVFNSVSFCTSECIASGYPFSGLYKESCYCAKSLISSTESGGVCNAACPGSALQSCGGDLLIGAKGLQSKLFDVYECIVSALPTSTISETATSTADAIPDPSSDAEEPIFIEARFEAPKKAARGIKLRRGGVLRSAEKKSHDNIKVKRDFGIKNLM